MKPHIGVVMVMVMVLAAAVRHATTSILDNAMIQRTVAFVVIGAGTAFQAEGVSPPDRYQATIVSDLAGTPCFGVPDTRSARRSPPLIRGNAVAEPGMAQEPTWQVSFVGERSDGKRTLPGQCLRYGDGGEAAVVVLKPGTLYMVSMWGRSTEAGKPPEVRNYSGYFCIEQSGGVPTVRQMDPSEGTAVMEQCASQRLGAGP